MARRLREMESRGLVIRFVLNTSPVAVDYCITPFGKTAIRFLDQLRTWSTALPDGARRA
ncbi:MAG: winged helix-turn-helix transcriptional regulator [Pseudomonadota bacterium]